jgi:hypothetical protein
MGLGLGLGPGLLHLEYRYTHTHTHNLFMFLFTYALAGSLGQFHCVRWWEGKEVMRHPSLYFELRIEVEAKRERERAGLQ